MGSNPWRLFSVEKWGLFFTRGNRFFWAMGAVYIQSPKLSNLILAQLSRTIPTAPSGQAFVRWGLKRNSHSKPAILITGIGRLGNSVIQTLNALHLARLLGTKTIFYHRFDAIHNAKLDLGSGISAQKLPAVATPNAARPGLIWRTYAMVSDTLISDPCNSQFFVARLSLAKKMNLGNTPANNRRSPQALTIHLRSGDVFSDRPHAGYGQPPWAFYERVLSHKEWAEVHLVSEDFGSPVRQKIVAWCQGRAVKLIESGATLTDAVREVSIATSLVLARGTFAPAILFLAPENRTLYLFDETPHALICQNVNTIYRITDRKGAFARSVLRDNWENTPHQRSLMVTYPIAHLSKPKKDPV